MHDVNNNDRHNTSKPDKAQHKKKALLQVWTLTDQFKLNSP